MRLLALALLLLVPAFLLLLRGNFKRQGSEKALARERAATTAKLAAANESYYVRQTRQQLATMTQFPMTLMLDHALTERGLKSLKRLQPDYDDFGLVETNGTVFCHTLGSNAAPTVSPSLVQKVLATRDFSAGVFTRAAAGSNVILQFGFPVLRTNGDIARVMYASLKTHLLSDVLTNVSLPHGGIATVFDGAGTVLARQPDSAEWIGKRSDSLFQRALAQKEGVFESAGPDGIQRVYAVSPVSDPEKPVLWVTVGIPRREIFAQADEKFVGNSIVALLAVALLLGAAWWYSDRLFVRPAIAIVSAADQINAGNLKARTGLPRGKSELHRLAERFDQMAASLEKRQRELERANLEIKSHNAELEKRVAERTSELQSLNGELEAFSYSVSHDLRAPLRHMHGFAQMVLKNPKLQEDATIQRQLGVIVSSAGEMGTLIDDLLAFSRLGRQSLTMNQVDFARLVREVVAEAVAREPEREVEWRIEPLPVVRGDAAFLRVVWVNLISNAVKYTRERKPAIIAISSRNTGDETEFSVRDNGAGFDMAYADRLFGVFQRLHLPEEFEGTGVGLANVRRIVSRHGGRTWAEGKIDEGATVSFSLPNTASQ